jgi:hypothetical protein
MYTTVAHSLPGILDMIGTQHCSVHALVAAWRIGYQQTLALSAARAVALERQSCCSMH